MLVEEVALRSELVFCFFYLNKVLMVFDNRTGKNLIEGWFCLKVG